MAKGFQPLGQGGSGVEEGGGEGGEGGEGGGGREGEVGGGKSGVGGGVVDPMLLPRDLAMPSVTMAGGRAGFATPSAVIDDDDAPDADTRARCQHHSSHVHRY